MKTVFSAIASGNIYEQLEGNLRESSSATASLCNDLTPAKVSIENLGDSQLCVLFHALTALLRACNHHKYPATQISKTFNRWYAVSLSHVDTYHRPLDEQLFLFMTELAIVDETFFDKLLAVYFSGKHTDLLVRVNKYLAMQNTLSYFSRLGLFLSDSQTAFAALQLLCVTLAQEVSVMIIFHTEFLMLLVTRLH